jgi:hypothetical protein
MEVLKGIGIDGLAVLVCFYLVRDVLGPLVRSVVKKRKTATEDRATVATTTENRVLALELNWAAVTAQVVSLEALLNRTAQSLDHKADTMLVRLTEIRDEQAEHNRLMAERMARAETHIDNIKERLANKAEGR